ncbi:MAG: cellulase family glycosylhydrolase [Clostridiales bacterium]|nr:cellulase family glycosylhydrolase [Clostridiales bacterium]
MDRIFTKEMRFVDENGRTRLFNGFNIDDKHLDRKEFRHNLDDEFFKKFKANGLDIIRLAVTWQNLEPEMGVYNESYLESIDRIFDMAEKYGVYILLDMHQDLYSGFDGKSVGDGAPSWASITDGAKPRKPFFVWAEGYFWGKAVHRAFDHFWDNSPVNGEGIQDRYRKLWKMLADRYGNKNALFGFDLMNEPFPGSDSKRMFIALIGGAAKVFLFSGDINRCSLLTSVIRLDMPGILNNITGGAMAKIAGHVDKLAEQFDLNKYSPFLNKTASAIREKTSNGIIMMEQSYLCNVGVKQSVPPITVNGVREPNQCYGPHSYDMTVDTPLYKYANADRVKTFFSQMRNAQERLNIPVIVGEWGGNSDNSDTSWFPHAFELLDFFDEKQWGQIYWTFKDNDLDSPLMEMLRRTHPVAIAGELKSYGYDRENKVFTLKYTDDSKGETLIYVHKPFTTDIKYKTVEKHDNGSSVISIKSKGETEVKIQIEE